MKAIFVEGNRNGYSPDQCGRTMTVGELIEMLEQFESDRLVYLRNDNGYTYGSVRECDFSYSENYDEFNDDEEEE